MEECTCWNWRRRRERVPWRDREEKKLVERWREKDGVMEWRRIWLERRLKLSEEETCFDRSDEQYVEKAMSLQKKWRELHSTCETLALEQSGGLWQTISLLEKSNSTVKAMSPSCSWLKQALIDCEDRAACSQYLKREATALRTWEEARLEPRRGRMQVDSVKRGSVKASAAESKWAIYYEQSATKSPMQREETQVTSIDLDCYQWKEPY
jgi:hypothetical protein